MENRREGRKITTHGERIDRGGGGGGGLEGRERERDRERISERD